MAWWQLILIFISILLTAFQGMMQYIEKDTFGERELWGRLELSEENIGRIKRSQSYRSRVERFLEQYFDDSYVRRFQEKDVLALEQFLKELLD
jgi:hypothetical protein